jgi:hypothetical protein
MLSISLKDAALHQSRLLNTSYRKDITPRNAWRKASGISQPAASAFYDHFFRATRHCGCAVMSETSVDYGVRTRHELIGICRPQLALPQSSEKRPKEEPLPLGPDAARVGARQAADLDAGASQARGGRSRSSPLEPKARSRSNRQVRVVLNLAANGAAFFRALRGAKAKQGPPYGDPCMPAPRNENPYRIVTSSAGDAPLLAAKACWRLPPYRRQGPRVGSGAGCRSLAVGI